MSGVVKNPVNSILLPSGLLAWIRWNFYSMADLSSGREKGFSVTVAYFKIVSFSFSRISNVKGTLEVVKSSSTI